MKFLQDLENLLKSRKQDLPENSYTAQLFKGGRDKILKKIGEEAGEVIIAAKNQDRAELTHEAADLLFHLQVLLVNENLPFSEVIKLLEHRHAER